MSLLAWTKRLIADVRGGTAVTFGLLAIPLALIALGSIDFARVSLLHQQLQEALDTSALMVARSDATTDAAIDKMGDGIFMEHMPNAAGTYAATFKAGSKDEVIVATATGDTQPLIMGLIGKSKMTARATTVVKRGQGIPVELALVLDTTGSMEGQPIIDQKAAATNLTTELFKNSNGTNVKIGVVPFGQYVNVGVSRRNESWINVPADYTETIAAGPCTWQTTTTTCQTEKYSCTKTNDGKPYQTTCSRNVNCVTKALNPPKQVCPFAQTRQHKFYGCVGSPAYPKNVRDDDPSRVYPGFLDVACNSEMTPLSNDEKTVTGAIKLLTAKDYTYIPAGLAWGFNMLSQPKPLTEAAAYDKTGKNVDPRKVLVLMTDGANTVVMNKANGKHDKQASPATEADTYVGELCENIKKQKMELYTVAFNLDDKAAKKMLSACATDGDHFFDASDAKKLNAAFGTIAEALQNLYIAK